ncbi:hypothetical protein [Streptomyces sp. NPDC003863]
MTPKAGGPADHFHRTISETFFVLDGERWADAVEGDFLFFPKHDTYGTDRGPGLTGPAPSSPPPRTAAPP